MQKLTWKNQLLQYLNLRSVTHVKFLFFFCRCSPPYIPNHVLLNYGEEEDIPGRDEYFPRVNTLSRVTQGMKVISTAQLKQAGTSTEQQQYRKILEADVHSSENGKPIHSCYVGEESGDHSCIFLLIKSHGKRI